MTTPEQISLPVPNADMRSTMYTRIADVHRQFVDAKWRAGTAGAQLRINPQVLVHCEEAIAFLAEEVLKLRDMVEKLRPESVNDVADRLEESDG